MALHVERFSKLRPFLYHLTDPVNLIQMCETVAIEPAAELMRKAGRFDLLRERRREHERISLGSRDVVLRDQGPLHAANVAFPTGFGIEDLVESLNRRVFFWPGTEAGPSDYGVRHFERYRSEEPTVLRMPFASLIRANPGAQPMFCGYNSGSPRCSAGLKSPRGPGTFAAAAAFDGPPSDVVEVTFERVLRIPPDAEYGHEPTGPWLRLL